MTGQAYVAIAGPIAVGKTTLAERLAERWGWPLLREQFERNPFLAEFYRRRDDARTLALPTELYFLWSRFEQLRTAPPAGRGARGPLLTDYTFAKGLLFAAITLEASEQALYRRLWDVLIDRVRRPDGIIYLTDGTDRLLERVRDRGRPMERAITADYVDPLRRSYEEFFGERPGSVLCVDCRRNDLLAEATLRRIETFVARLADRASTNV